MKLIEKIEFLYFSNNSNPISVQYWLGPKTVIFQAYLMGLINERHWSHKLWIMTSSLDMGNLFSMNGSFRDDKKGKEGLLSEIRSPNYLPAKLQQLK